MAIVHDFEQSTEHLELIEARLRRLMRSVELKAPQIILENEYEWFKVEVQRLHNALLHKDISYTEEQIKELNWLIEMESDAEED